MEARRQGGRGRGRIVLAWDTEQVEESPGIPPVVEVKEVVEVKVPSTTKVSVKPPTDEMIGKSAFEKPPPWSPLSEKEENDGRHIKKTCRRMVIVGVGHPYPAKAEDAAAKLKFQKLKEQFDDDPDDEQQQPQKNLREDRKIETIDVEESLEHELEEAQDLSDYREGIQPVVKRQFKLPACLPDDKLSFRTFLEQQGMLKIHSGLKEKKPVEKLETAVVGEEEDTAEARVKAFLARKNVSSEASADDSSTSIIRKVPEDEKVSAEGKLSTPSAGKEEQKLLETEQQTPLQDLQVAKQIEKRRDVGVGSDTSWSRSEELLFIPDNRHFGVFKPKVDFPPCLITGNMSFKTFLEKTGQLVKFLSSL